MQNIYQKWGFKSNPFEVKEIKGSEEGKKLLIGRDEEKEKIQRRVLNPPKCLTVEGNNGVGKTSLINVVCYDLFHNCVENTDKPLLIPCNTSFQISQEKDVDEFSDYVYYAIAQTFITNKGLLKKNGIELHETTAIDDFLNTYSLVAISAGIAGFSAGESIELNQGDAFNRSGFRKIVDEWIGILHSHQFGGAIICVLDNIELLKTSEEAKKRFEYLRDILFVKDGLRWILSGSTGIFLGTASSPRLSGIIYNPIKIEGLSENYATAIYESRVNFYRNADSPYLPIEIDGLKLLLDLLNGNIRHVLDYIDEYCMWCIDYDRFPDTNDQKLEELNNWLDHFSGQVLDAMEQSVKAKGINFFEDACSLGRHFNYTEHNNFGFDNTSEMSKYVAQLESVELLYSYKKEDNKRVQLGITPKGLIVYKMRLKKD